MRVAVWQPAPHPLDPEGALARLDAALADLLAAKDSR